MMKMKMKALVAVTALAIGAQAQAAIFDDLASNPTTGTGAGELFLSVVDRGALVPRSYIRDLGITVNEFRANPTAALNFAADANLTDILTNKTGTIYWNIVGMSNTTTPTPNDYGYLSTTPLSLTLTPNNVVQGFNGIQGAGTKVGSYVGTANFALGTGVGDPAITNYAANVSQIITDANSLAFYDRGGWGDLWNGAHSSEATLGATGQSMSFWFVGMDYVADPNTLTSYTQKAPGQWTLAANGNLGYSAAAVPAVPVPAAVWLLGSALVGLVGVARRKLEPVQA